MFLNMNDKKIGVGFGVMFLKNDAILLGKRHDDPEKADSALHGEGTWTMSGGKLHYKEKPEEGAQREVMEETGLRVALHDLKMISFTNEMVEDAHFVTCGFLCEKFEGEVQVMEPDEITEWKWFSLSEVPSNTSPHSLKILKNYQDKEFYKH